MKKLCESISSFCETAIKYIALIPLLFLFIACLIYRNTITFDIFETSIVLRNGIKFFLVTSISIPVLYLVYWVMKYIPEVVLFGVFSLIYLLAGTYLFLHMETVLRHDSGICYWNALNFVEGNYTNLQFGEYFYKWPHQLGLVSYNCLLIFLCNNLNMVYFANLFWVILTNLVLWLTTRLLYEDKPTIRKLTILLTFCFLPQFFYVIFAYGQVPGLCFLVSSLYFIIWYMKKGCVWKLIPSILCMAGACVLGMNYMIGGVAIIIILFMDLLKTRKGSHVIIICAIVCSMIIPNKLIISHYEKVADADLSQGMPMLLYVAMGLQENEEENANWRANGWYNDYSSITYLETNCDQQESSRLAMEFIKERFSKFIREPDYAFYFFKEKLVTTWCEPTFQAIWSGPLIAFGSTTDVPLLEELYTGGAVFGNLAAVMNVLVVFVFGFAFVYLVISTFVKKKSWNLYELFAILFFLGGFIFHMFWETKSRYVYFYVVLLIPFACCGIQTFFGKIDNLAVKKKR